MGFNGYDLFDNLLVKRPVKNQYLDQDQMKGLLYTSPELAEDDFTNGSIAVMTGEDSVTVKEEDVYKRQTWICSCRISWPL